MTYTSRADALTPGDWSSLKDFIRDIAHALDNAVPPNHDTTASAINLLKLHIQDLSERLELLEDD